MYKLKGAAVATLVLDDLVEDSHFTDLRPSPTVAINIV
jgi:hypothetical protein